MTKVKILMIMFLIISAVLMLPNMAMATADNITSEKIVTSTNGSVEYIIKGLNLEEGESYQWAIEKSPNANITNWYDCKSSTEQSTGSIQITISIDDKNQLTILKSTDTAYITIRKAGENNIVLENYKIDLSLPLLKSFVVDKSKYYDRNVPSNPAFEISSVYGLNSDNIQYKWEKITDANIINSFIDNDHDLSGLNLKGKSDFPSLVDSSWKSIDWNVTKKFMRVNNGHLPAEDGLYYLWLKGSSNDVKIIYGQAVLEVGEVTKINTTPNNNSNNNNNNQNSQNQQTTGSNNNQNLQTPQKDNTTATGKLPQTGLKMGIVTMIIFVAGIVIFTYFRYNKFRDIK